MITYFIRRPVELVFPVFISRIPLVGFGFMLLSCQVVLTNDDSHRSSLIRFGQLALRIPIQNLRNARQSKDKMVTTDPFIKIEVAQQFVQVVEVNVRSLVSRRTRSRVLVSRIWRLLELAQWYFLWCLWPGRNESPSRFRSG